MLRHDYKTMYRMQIEERKTFNYPPLVRMIRINLKHRDRAALDAFAEILGRDLKDAFGKGFLGGVPLISRIQSWYIKTLLIKIENRNLCKKPGR